MNSSITWDDDVSLPVLHTNDLAQRVFEKFGLNGDVKNSFVADLVVPARAQERPDPGREPSSLPVTKPTGFTTVDR